MDLLRDRQGLGVDPRDLQGWEVDLRWLLGLGMDLAEVCFVTVDCM